MRALRRGWAWLALPLLGLFAHGGCREGTAGRPVLVHRLARETWAATRLEVPRKQLLPRVVVPTPGALAWRTVAGSVDAQPGTVRLSAGSVAEASVALTPTVSYSLRASGEGEMALDVRKRAGGQTSEWETVAAQRTSSSIVFEHDLSHGAGQLELRLRATSQARLSAFEISERPFRSRLHVTNAMDSALRGFVRQTTELDHVLDSLLATGRSEYQWPIAPASHDRVLTVEISSVDRHGEDREPPAPVAMIVDLHADGQWFEAVRRPRGGREGARGWLALRLEIKHADAVRLRTEPMGPGQAATVAWGMPTLRPAARGTLPDVFIFTLDAIRNDQLGAYGSPAGLTPTLDRLAARSVVFDEARTSRGNTWEGLAGIAFADFPERVGVARQGDLPYRGARSIAQVFGDAGYLTMRLGWSLMPPGMLGAMDIEEDADLGQVGDDAIAASVRRLLAHHGDTPLFVWVHLSSTHYPYEPEARFRPEGSTAEKAAIPDFSRTVKERGPPDAIAYYQALYQACVRQTDAHLAELLDPLLRTDRPGGQPIVAILADHGSHHGERNLWFVHATLARSVLRVPFLIYAPERIAPRRIATLTRTIDLGPTLLHYAGLPAGGFYGESMHDLIEGRPARERINIVRKMMYGVYSVEDDRFKLIVNPDDQKFYWPQFGGLTIDWPTIELFNWRNDPDETRNLAAREPLAVGELWRQLGSTRLVIDRPITPEVRRLLTQAGYLPAETPPGP